ncbi:MAG TPA: hydroxymethylbilane synthase [Thermoleophilaceae bacterium]|jgi:hydroxymethylbilane synthase
MTPPLRLGTRGSALALAQARMVASMLDADVVLVPITTSGDEHSTTLRKGSDPVTGSPTRNAPVTGSDPPPAGEKGGGSDPHPSPLSRTPADKSRFVKEIEEALLREDVDLAVHSAKDVPGELPDGLAIVGVPERADARDALCGAAALDDLPEGARVGTSSLRRRAQLLALRPDLRVSDLRGNVDTRLRRLADGDYHAIVLAMAGLERLDRAREGSPIPPADFVPAPGQGCLALEARVDDERSIELGAAVTDRAALQALTAERALVVTLEATCRTPVAAHAERSEAGLRLTAFAGLPDGSRWIRDGLSIDAGHPSELGTGVADRLLAAGAAELLAEAETAAPSR